MDRLLDYFLRVTPGCALAIVLLALLPRTLSGARLCVHIGMFILVRDAMTPVGLWRISEAPPYWVRLSSDPRELLALAAASTALLVVIRWLEPQLAHTLTWWRGSRVFAVAAGAAGGLLVALPVFALSWDTPVDARGGAVSASLVPVLFLFAMCGNAYEELLFRGYLQGSLLKHMSTGRAALVAGLSFAFGHAFLATSVTHAGVAVLAFTAYEGLICAELQRRAGLVAAIVAHGTGIFLAASGLP